jgi:hypothetical protein
MASNKVPPHVAKELRRHLAKQQGPSINGGSDGSSSSRGGGPALLAALALTATMTIVPYFFMNWIRPLNERDDALTGSQIRRGAFNNSGSKDVGKDPYWNFKKGRRVKVGDDGVEDDGGYEELFSRENPDVINREVELAAAAKSRRDKM